VPGVRVCDAIATVPGTDPDGASYQAADETPSHGDPGPQRRHRHGGPGRDHRRAVLAQSAPAASAPRRRPRGQIPGWTAGTNTRPASPASTSGSPRSPPRSEPGTSQKQHPASSAW